MTAAPDPDRDFRPPMPAAVPAPPATAGSPAGGAALSLIHI